MASSDVVDADLACSTNIPALVADIDKAHCPAASAVQEALAEWSREIVTNVAGFAPPVITLKGTFLERIGEITSIPNP